MAMVFMMFHHGDTDSRRNPNAKKLNRNGRFF
jgi:hypothetical protein